MLDMRWLQVAAVGAASPAMARDSGIDMAPVPGWVVQAPQLAVPADASGLMFVRRLDSVSHLDRKVGSNYLRFRVRLLDANALERPVDRPRLGRAEVDWVADDGAYLAPGTPR